MHHRILALALFVLSFSMFGEEVRQPSDYLEILTASKLMYNFISEPSTSPVEELKCPRRDERTRVVVENGEKKLAARDVKLEALKLVLEGEKHYRAERMKRGQGEVRGGDRGRSAARSRRTSLTAMRC